MTTITADTRPQTRLSGVLRSERIKLTSIRSTVWSAILTVALPASFVALMAFGLAMAPTAPGVDVDEMILQTFGPAPTLGAIGYAFLFAPAFVGLLGALVVSTERSNGLIASTVAAVPNRRLVVAAKLIASTAVSFALGLLIGAVSYGIAEPAFLMNGYAQTLADPVALQVLLGGALYLALVGTISTALAFLFRSTAAAVGAVLVLLLVLPGILSLIPVVGGTLSAVMPTNLGAQLFMPVTDASWAGPAFGLAGLLVWAAASITAAAVSFSRSDA